MPGACGGWVHRYIADEDSVTVDIVAGGTVRFHYVPLYPQCACVDGSFSWVLPPEATVDVVVTSEVVSWNWQCVPVNQPGVLVGCGQSFDSRCNPFSSALSAACAVSLNDPNDATCASVIGTPQLWFTLWPTPCNPSSPYANFWSGPCHTFIPAHGATGVHLLTAGGGYGCPVTGFNGTVFCVSVSFVLQGNGVTSAADYPWSDGCKGMSPDTQLLGRGRSPTNPLSGIRTETVDEVAAVPDPNTWAVDPGVVDPNKVQSQVDAVLTQPVLVDRWFGFHGVGLPTQEQVSQDVVSDGFANRVSVLFPGSAMWSVVSDQDGPYGMYVDTSLGDKFSSGWEAPGMRGPRHQDVWVVYKQYAGYLRDAATVCVVVWTTIAAIQIVTTGG